MLVVTNFIESIFNPVISILDLIISKLSSIGTVAAKGVRVSDYFGFFNILGNAWSSLIMQFIAALTFIFVLYMIQKYNRVLLWFKDLIKWW